MINKIGIVLLLMMGCFLIFSLLVFLYRYRKSSHYQRAIQKILKKKGNGTKVPNPEPPISENTHSTEQTREDGLGDLNCQVVFKEEGDQDMKISGQEKPEKLFFSERFEIIQSITRTDAMETDYNQQAQQAEMFDGDETLSFEPEETHHNKALH